jgi:hypothetical protein
MITNQLGQGWVVLQGEPLDHPEHNQEGMESTTERWGNDDQKEIHVEN